MNESDLTCWVGLATSISFWHSTEQKQEILIPLKIVIYKRTQIMFKKFYRPEFALSKCTPFSFPCRGPEFCVNDSIVFFKCFFSTWCLNVSYNTYWNIKIYVLPFWTSCAVCSSSSVMSDSLWPHGQEAARLLCLWDSPGKNTGLNCHALLQGIFLLQGSNLHFLCI